MSALCEIKIAFLDLFGNFLLRQKIISGIFDLPDTIKAQFRPSVPESSERQAASAGICGHPWPHEWEGPASAAQREG